MDVVGSEMETAPIRENDNSERLGIIDVSNRNWRISKTNEEIGGYRQLAFQKEKRLERRRSREWILNKKTNKLQSPPHVKYAIGRKIESKDSHFENFIKSDGVSVLKKEFNETNRELPSPRRIKRQWGEEELPQCSSAITPQIWSKIDRGLIDKTKKLSGSETENLFKEEGENCPIPSWPMTPREDVLSDKIFQKCGNSESLFKNIRCSIGFSHLKFSNELDSTSKLNSKSNKIKKSKSNNVNKRKKLTDRFSSFIKRYNCFHMFNKLKRKTFLSNIGEKTQKVHKNSWKNKRIEVEVITKRCFVKNQTFKRPISQRRIKKKTMPKIHRKNFKKQDKHARKGPVSISCKAHLRKSDLEALTSQLFSFSFSSEFQSRKESGWERDSSNKDRTNECLFNPNRCFKEVHEAAVGHSFTIRTRKTE